MKSQSKLIAAIVGALAAYFLGAFLISYALIHPKRKKQLDPKTFGISYKKVTFKSIDGIKLAGWFISAKNPRATIIASHGYGYSKSDLLAASKVLVKNNYNVLLFDYRAHGESEGKVSGIGCLEVSDLLGAIKFVKSLGEKKIGLIGVSMGASTSIIAAAKENVKCVIADSGYGDLSSVLKDKLALLSGPVIKLLQAQGVGVNKNKPIDFVSKVRCPILIIHCKKDKLVRVSHGEELYKKANNPKKLWLIDYDDHGRGYYKDPKLYERKVLDFLGRCFAK